MKMAALFFGAVTRQWSSLRHRVSFPARHTRMPRRSRLALPIVMTAAALLVVAISVPALIQATGPAYSFRIVATLGDAAPGGGEHEGDFEPQDINASGTVMFASDLENENGFAGEGVFRSSRGVNSQIMRQGLPAPGTSSDFGGFGILQPGGLNDAGDMSFGFTLLPPTGNSGVWRYSEATGTLTKVLVPGDPAPGGTTFRGASFHTDLNNRGEIVTVGIIDTAFGLGAGRAAVSTRSTGSMTCRRLRLPGSGAGIEQHI